MFFEIQQKLVTQIIMMKAYNYYKKKQGIGAIRMVLGLTQQALASQLGISRGFLSNAENNKRSLPTPAMLKLALLHARITGTKTPPESGNATPATGTHERSEEPVLELLKKLEQEAARLQHRLQVMICTHAHLVQCLDNVEGLLYAPQNKDAGKGLPYLKIHRSIIIRKITKCSPGMQAVLRKKIALLRAAAALK